MFRRNAHTSPILGSILTALLGLAAIPGSALAQSDIFLQGGFLRGLGNTTWTYEGGFISQRSKHLGLGFAYYNEGHIPDNHRDGLAAQAWYLQPLSNDFEIQLGAGPYATMNNTTADGVRVNDFKLGVLTSAALKWHPTGAPWYLRLQYNYAWVPASLNTNALLLGVGRDFAYQDNGDDDSKRLNMEFSFWGGSSRTTQIGTQNTAIAYELETKFHFNGSENLGYSVGLLSEGDTNLSHRRGVPVRFWYDQHLTKKFTVGAGIGPYVAYNGSNIRELEVIGIGSLRATWLLTKRFGLGLMYTRVASFANRDQDIGMLGLLMKL